MRKWIRSLLWVRRVARWLLLDHTHEVLSAAYRRRDIDSRVLHVLDARLKYGGL